MIYYKILSAGHRACHGGNYTYRPNRWTKRITEPVACRFGYHVADADHLSMYLYAEGDDILPLEVWECEAEGITDNGDKYVCERIKLTRLVGTLDGDDLRWLGSEFAILALPNTDDPRVGECINTARAYSLGVADTNDLSAASLAARSAARAAADSAASLADPAQGQIVLDYLEEWRRP